jgi:hypothetical protein
VEWEGPLENGRVVVIGDLDTVESEDLNIRGDIPGIGIERVRNTGCMIVSLREA